MIAQGMLLPLNILREGQSFNLPDQELWLIRASENNSVQLVISKNSNHMSWVVENDSLILLDRVNVNVTSSTLIYHKVRIDILSKLLAFVDEAKNADILQRNNCNF
ncbi:hypothetical protein ACNSPD_01295, partial [Yersinia enterocolitica]